MNFIIIELNIWCLFFDLTQIILQEGYQSILNTDIKRECDHMATVFKMALKYKQENNMTAQFLIEPKPREPTKHQYDYDAQTTIAFLHTYGLEKDFKLNIEPNHTTL